MHTSRETQRRVDGRARSTFQQPGLQRQLHTNNQQVGSTVTRASTGSSPGGPAATLAGREAVRSSRGCTTNKHCAVQSQRQWRLACLAVQARPLGPNPSFAGMQPTGTKTGELAGGSKTTATPRQQQQRQHRARQQPRQGKGPLQGAYAPALVVLLLLFRSSRSSAGTAHPRCCCRRRVCVPAARQQSLPA